MIRANLTIEPATVFKQLVKNPGNELAENSREIDRMFNELARMAESDQQV